MTVAMLHSDLLAPLRHGFFTRAGGASSGVFEGLNCGHGSSDQTQAVEINRARVADAMGLPPEGLRTVHQIHSASVAVIEGTPPSDGPPEADAMVTADPDVALGILTADCMPILFADVDGGVAGAAHAGWRGAVGGVIEATIDAMVDLGARRDRIVAAIGPSISQASYEVGPELLDTFLEEDDTAHRFFAGGQGDRLHLDLPGYGLSRLRAAGIDAAGWTRHCTYLDADRFFSYRRSVHRKEADYGRLISAIRLG